MKFYKVNPDKIRFQIKKYSTRRLFVLHMIINRDYKNYPNMVYTNSKSQGDTDHFLTLQTIEREIRNRTITCNKNGAIIILPYRLDFILNLIEDIPYLSRTFTPLCKTR